MSLQYDYISFKHDWNVFSSEGNVQIDVFIYPTIQEVQSTDKEFKDWWIQHSTETNSLVGKEFACNAGGPSSISRSRRSAGERICCPLRYSWASLGTQLVKDLPAVRETWIWSLDLEDPLEKGKATHSSILAWRIPWTVYSPWGHKEADRTEQLSLSLKPEMLNVYPVGINTHFNALWSLPTKATHVAQSVHSLPWKDKACDLGNPSGIYLLLIYSFRYGSLNLVGRL